MRKGFLGNLKEGVCSNKRTAGLQAVQQVRMSNIVEKEGSFLSQLEEGLWLQASESDSAARVETMRPCQSPGTPGPPFCKLSRERTAGRPLTSRPPPQDKEGGDLRVEGRDNQIPLTQGQSPGQHSGSASSPSSDTCSCEGGVGVGRLMGTGTRSP